MSNLFRLHSARRVRIVAETDATFYFGEQSVVLSVDLVRYGIEMDPVDEEFVHCEWGDHTHVIRTKGDDLLLLLDRAQYVHASHYLLLG